jgi:hypothetical protein
METNNGFKDDRSTSAKESHHQTNNRVIIGAILVLAGLFLAIRNTGFFPDFIDNVIFSWPMLLITIGVILTLGSRDKTAGIIVMAVGGFFMIPLLFRETFHMYNMFWPSIFIIVGIIFIVTRKKGPSPVKSKGMIGDDVIDYVNIISGFSVITSSNSIPVSMGIWISRKTRSGFRDIIVFKPEKPSEHSATTSMYARSSRYFLIISRAGASSSIMRVLI